ncbi:hypothetical protein V8C86DRAFT_2616618 [Haematococcus lacustris]|nr:hypothetical protein QJQ45_026421 [Haematococcus lacustris]
MGQQEPVEWHPTQHPVPERHDYRCAVLGPKGYKEKGKRKLDDMQALHDQDLEQAAAQMTDTLDSACKLDEAAVAQPSSKRRKGEDGGGIPVSGRTWKVSAQRAAIVMKAKTGSTWEKKIAVKASREAFVQQKKEAVTAAKEKRKAKALQRKAAMERKKANKAKSEVVQKITNSATVKKMLKSKKQRKLIKTADTN